MRENHPALGSIRDAYRFQREFQYYGYDQIREFQLRELKSLIHHASKTVPFYNKLYQGIQQITNFEQFEALPVVKKDDLVNIELDELTSSELTYDTVPKIVVKSSGTTGEPIVLTRSLRTEIWRAACRLLEYEWMNLEPSGNCMIGRFTISPDAEGYDPMERIIRKEFWEEGSLNRLIRFGEGYQVSAGEYADWIAELLERFNPEIVVFGPTTFQEVLPFIKNYQAKSLISMGEKLHSNVREKIEQKFGCKVANLYGANEVGRIASSCPDSVGFHVHDSNVFMEIVNEYGKPVAEGEAGIVLLTTLQNPGMPLIRYRIGDYIQRTYKRCDCGRGLSRFLNFEGRESAQITLRNGKTVWAGKVADYIEGLNMAAHYRIRQTGFNEFKFECTNKLRLSNEITNQIASMIEKLVGEEIHLESKNVEYIEPLPSGKRNWFLKEF